MIDGWGISCELALRWMSLDLTDDRSTLVQVKAWCRQATSHNPSQSWLRSLSPYGVTRPQWDKYSMVRGKQTRFVVPCFLWFLGIVSSTIANCPNISGVWIRLKPMLSTFVLHFGRPSSAHCRVVVNFFTTIYTRQCHIFENLVM